MITTNQDKNKLLRMARGVKNWIDTIYLHWTAGRYGQYFDDYHICIDSDGSLKFMTDDLSTPKNHTWHRNSEAIGIALCCCYGAQANNGIDTDFGDYPPTKEQIETMAEAVAILMKGMGLSIEEDTVMTHCEAAAIDGYGPYSDDQDTRWDLWYLPDFNGMSPGGDVIRGKAIWYQTRGV